MSTELYRILGVPKSATDAEVKKAYRKLTKKLHPDLNPGDSAAEERFKKVSAAYGILGDAEKRKQYDAGEIDASGAETPQQQYYRQYADANGQNPYQGHSGYEDMSDLFSGMFRQQRGGFRQAAMKGEDLRYHMEVSFLEAALGAKKQVQMADGSNLSVSIPKGIEDGKSIRLKGKGNPGLNGGPSGDALIQIKVRPHKVFKRNGLDIELTLPITIAEAALGDKVAVPTLHGNVGLTIPEGSNSGKVMRLKGRGIETPRGKKGDQLVTLSVQMPEDIDAELSDFLKSWAARHPYDPRTKLKGANDV